MSPALAEVICIFSELPAKVYQYGAVLAWLYQTDVFSQGGIHQPLLKKGWHTAALEVLSSK